VFETLGRGSSGSRSTLRGSSWRTNRGVRVKRKLRFGAGLAVAAVVAAPAVAAGATGDGESDPATQTSMWECNRQIDAVIAEDMESFASFDGERWGAVHREDARSPSSLAVRWSSAATTSPGPTRTRPTRSSACWVPHVTSTSSAVAVTPWATPRWRAMAARRPGCPAGSP
jgi:hypothetical protein